jgi:hypothetical protein
VKYYDGRGEPSHSHRRVDALVQLISVNCGASIIVSGNNAISSIVEIVPTFLWKNSHMDNYLRRSVIPEYQLLLPSPQLSGGGTRAILQRAMQNPVLYPSAFRPGL